MELKSLNVEALCTVGLDVLSVSWRDLAWSALHSKALHAFWEEVPDARISFFFEQPRASWN